MTLAEYIEKNWEVVNTLIKLGAMPYTYINYLQIYRCFTDMEKEEPSKMKRYYAASFKSGVELNCVRRAVKIMESSLPKKQSINQNHL